MKWIGRVVALGILVWLFVANPEWMARLGLPTLDELGVSTFPPVRLNEESLSDETIEERLEALLTEKRDPSKPVRFAVELNGCVLTRSILHDQDLVCSRGPGGWYRNDRSIDLRVVLTSPRVAEVRGTDHDFEAVEWPLRST
ncbi:MAG: hypothetical protein AAGC81_16635 [Pseudomonadota bacterium]